jgi:hypothetical protein
VIEFKLGEGLGDLETGRPGEWLKTETGSEKREKDKNDEGKA